jgi:hypothetical protein
MHKQLLQLLTPIHGESKDSGIKALAQFQNMYNCIVTMIIDIIAFPCGHNSSVEQIIACIFHYLREDIAQLSVLQDGDW